MTAMLRSGPDAQAPARRLRSAVLGRAVRLPLASVMTALSGPRSQSPDAGPEPAQDGPVDSVAGRFVTQRDGEATHRIWRGAAVGGGPGMR